MAYADRWSADRSSDIRSAVTLYMSWAAGWATPQNPDLLRWVIQSSFSSSHVISSHFVTSLASRMTIHGLENDPHHSSLWGGLLVIFGSSASTDMWRPR